MARLSFSSFTLLVSGAYRIWFHLFWMFLTYIALCIVWPMMSRASNLVSKKEIMDIERLMFDLWRIWQYPVIYIGLILLAGCIIGFLPRGPTRTKLTRSLLFHQFFYFIYDSASWWSTYFALQIGGFDILTQFCHDSKPADLPRDIARDIDDACSLTKPVITATLLGVIVMWKLFGLNMFLLTLNWHKVAVRDERDAQAKLEKEVQEGPGPIKLVGEDALSAEDKV